MYKIFSRFAVFVFISVMSFTFLPVDAASNLPTTIGGLKVLVTFLPGTTVCAPVNTIRIMLQSTAPTVQAYLASNQVQRITEELAQLQKVNSMKLQVSVVATDATVETILQRNAQSNEQLADFDCNQKPRKVTDNPLIGVNGQQFTYPSPEIGRVIFEDTDASSGTNNGQSVYLTSPSLIPTTLLPISSIMY